MIRLDRIPAKWEERVTLYCGFLSAEGIQSSTIKSYISAIKHKLLMDGYEWNGNLALFAALTRASKLKNDVLRTRLPIGKKFLEVILFEIQRKFSKDPYKRSLYKTIYLVAYHGLMRIGELTISPHVLKAVDVHDARNKQAFKFVLHSSKTHGRGDHPQKIRIEKVDKTTNFFCPVEEITNYLEIRGRFAKSINEPFFRFEDKQPITANHVRKTLKQVINNLHLDSSLYDTHSFRIGKATDMFKEGTTVEQIKEAGRWKSNAVYKYLR